MAVGEMGKKAIQFGKDVAYGLKGKTVGWAEGIGMREIQANMSEAQRKHIAEAGKKAGIEAPQNVKKTTNFIK